MPTEYVPTGHEFQRNDVKVTAMAPIYYCEGCGFKGAPFGIKDGETAQSYCGWESGRPVCVGKGRTSSV